MSVFKFDPRVSVSPPYISCPKCGKESFGIWTISDDRYYRRCKECLFPRTESPVCFLLPKLNKKVIYLDQFVISNMMKAVNPQTKAYHRASLNFWLDLFVILDRLCRLQLILCPDSIAHTNESLLSPHFDYLKRMYELLSHGVRFQHFDTIKRIQLCNHARNWFAGRPNRRIETDVHEIVHGDINAWQENFIISVTQKYDDTWISDIRKMRCKTSEALKRIFVRWQSEQRRSFHERFEEEYRAFGPEITRSYLEYLDMLSQRPEDQVWTIENFMPPPSVIWVRSIQNVFRKEGVPDSLLWQRTSEFLKCQSLQEIPFVKISAMLWAALARKASSGRRKLPNQGTVSDFDTISTLLPYCDAMFIDNECCSYLREQPLCEQIDYGTRIFSYRTKDEFIRYLVEIESSVSEGHLRKIREVYGDDWDKPYLSLYENTPKAL